MHAHPRARGRSGITLTEILISIMIMGIGLLSLATLFPIGLMRVREATRASRSALLISSAREDLSARGLLNNASFGFWYSWLPGPQGQPNSPFIHDPVNPTVPNNFGDPGVYHSFGKGLPFAYDPLWWSEIGLATGDTPLTLQCRFANGQGRIRNDPDGGPPSAHGLQRLTNFALAPALVAEVERIFASTDDIVYQSAGPPNTAEGIGSPIVPDLSGGGLLADLSFTWMFTGRQSDVTNSSVYEGDIVVFHNRPFNVQPGPVNYAQGETVVEAVFGYGGNPGTGYSLATNTVMLRWPADQPDPEIRVGGWIADVTYERFDAVEKTRFLDVGGFYPAQRCHWYRVARRSDPEPSPGAPGYRQVVVTLASPVRSRTLYNGGVPQINAALVSPYVVNVVPTIVYAR